MSTSSDPSAHRPTVRVGLLGCGNVGAALVGLLAERGEAVAAGSDVEIELAGIAVRSTTKDRGIDVDPALLTTDAEALVVDEDIDVIVELIGGIEPARTLVLQALKAGKPVVTGNKELLANHGAELYAAAEAAGADLLFEAAAAGAIPIMRPLRESLVGEDVGLVMGIVNGTTNYILTRMTEEGVAYEEVLADAQRLGYAERDPTADVEGYDAGAKAAIMASIAFGVNVVAGDVYHEGIGSISQDDIELARRFDYTIKPLAIAKRFNGGNGPEIGVWVYPAMVPNDHPLAAVRGSFNAVFVEGGAAGELMFYGRGAGGLPTASAVLGDLIDAAGNLRRGTFHPVPSGPRARIRSIDELETAYYIGITVSDDPGVLARVAGVFGRHGVSILAMQQEGQQEGRREGRHERVDGPAGSGAEARIAFITHTARERDVQATVAELRHLDDVHDIHSLLRVVES